MSASARNADTILKRLVVLTSPFNAHDVDRVMSHSVENVLEIPRGKGVRDLSKVWLCKTDWRDASRDAGRPLRRSDTLCRA
jgi:hypothetical protein